MAKLHILAAAAVVWVTCATADPMIPTPPSNGGAGSGTVTSVSVTTANGVAGTVATATTTPAITLSLGAITPTSVDVGAMSDTFLCRMGADILGVSSAASPCNGNGTLAATFYSFGTNTDTSLCRASANTVNVSNSTTACNSAGILAATTLVSTNYQGIQYRATGSAPTGTTGSCSVGTFVGGRTAGTFVAPLCAGGTIILSGFGASTNGYACEARDRTTSTDIVTQTASSTTSATFLATTAASDVVQFFCMAY